TFVGEGRELSRSVAEIERVAVVAKLELLGARHDARVSGGDAERMVADSYVRSAGTLECFYLRFADAANRHATFTALRLVSDLGALHAQDLADKRMDRCRGSARLARKDFSERIALLGRSARIKIQGDAPTPLVHGAWCREERGDVQS